MLAIYKGCGTEQNITGGVTWSLHRQIRLMAGIILVRTDAIANGNGTLIGNDRPKILQARLQVHF